MKLVFLSTVVALAAACMTTKSEEPPAPNTLSAAEEAAGWQLLFDGQTTAGWRGFQKEAAPAGWQVVAGALTRMGPGGDIVTEGQYGSFELAFEWRVTPGGNSGVFFHVVEADYDAVWRTGPEFQVLDNAKHQDGKNPLTSAASNYALNAPVEDRCNPVGQWNEARLSVHAGHVEHWLNGEKVVEYELWSDEWKEAVANSKFSTMASYGMQKRGHIALQDHGDEVAYRSIKILPLD